MSAFDMAPFELNPADFVLHDTVLWVVTGADKAPELTLQACSAWLAAQSAGMAAIWEASTS